MEDLEGGESGGKVEDLKGGGMTMEDDLVLGLMRPRNIFSRAQYWPEHSVLSYDFSCN